jgi:hypothetical protein
VPDIKKFGLHSLRSGGATTCANLGISDRLFKKHGRWSSETAKDGYVKDSLQINSLESAKMLPQTRYNSKFLTGHKFESVRTITTELPSLYISVLLFGVNMQIYVASKVIVTCKTVLCCYLLSSLVQSCRTVSPVTQTFYSLQWDRSS